MKDRSEGCEKVSALIAILIGYLYCAGAFVFYLLDKSRDALRFTWRIVKKFPAFIGGIIGSLIAIALMVGTWLYVIITRPFRAKR